MLVAVGWTRDHKTGILIIGTNSNVPCGFMGSTHPHQTKHLEPRTLAKSHFQNSLRPPELNYQADMYMDTVVSQYHDESIGRCNHIYYYSCGAI